MNSAKRLFWTCLLLFGSAVLLSLIQAPVCWSFLAWFSYVPLLLAAEPEARLGRLLWSSYLFGLVYWLVNLYWVGSVTVLGWLAFCGYTALLWPGLVYCIRYCRSKKIPLLLSAAVFIVGAERLQGFLLGGFFWRFLGHSQYENTFLIQIADIFGVPGISFLIGMANGLFAGFIVREGGRGLVSKGNIVKTVVVGGAVCITLLYGWWRIQQAEDYVTEGPRVGVVQSNVPQAVKESYEAKEEIFEDLLLLSRKAAGANPMLIIWPETMVQAVLNRKVWNYIEDNRWNKKVDKKIREHASQAGAHIIIGATDLEVNFDEKNSRRLKRYNSAIMYKRDGTRAGSKYNKMHLVPFGEVVPFRRSVPCLYRLLMAFTPYDYEYSLDYGQEYAIFEVEDGSLERDYRFGVMICYEDAVPKIARRFAIGAEGEKRVDWLVNISNDGWFVSFEEGRVKASAELVQHAAICVFRAIENRVSIVRSVNTGISCVIDSSGRIMSGYEDGDLPKNPIERTGIAGWFVDKMPIDKRITVFGRYGSWLDILCAICFAILVLGGVGRRVLHMVKKRRMGR